MQTGTPLAKGFVLGSQEHIDKRYNKEGIPYVSISEACELVAISQRVIGLSVQILDQEYWWKDGISNDDLVIKSGENSVIEFDNLGAFPEIGKVKIIYISKDTDLQYRWDGTEYVELSQLSFSLPLTKDGNGVSLSIDENTLEVVDEKLQVKDGVFPKLDETGKIPGNLIDPYNWKLKGITGNESIAATPPTDAEILANKTNGGYSRSGAKVYKKVGNDYIEDTDVPIITTPVIWENAAQNVTDGVMNRCAVWSSLDATAGQYVGFGREIIATAEKIYFIGVGADNYMSIEVNSIVIKSFPSGDTLNDHYESWHLLPVLLKEGSNLIHVRGYNDEGPAAIGVEIYDATLEQLQNVATIEALDALTVFSTKSLIGSYVEEGNFGTGYTCAEGYSLINRNGVYSCDRFVSGELTIEKNDVVEFKKGTTDEILISVDPLDSTHKIVELPKQPDKYEYWKLKAPKLNVKFGYLYNGFIHQDTRKITSSDEWNVSGSVYDQHSDISILKAFCNNQTDKLKENNLLYWDSITGVTNEYGFNARGSGWRVNGLFNFLKAQCMIGEHDPSSLEWSWGNPSNFYSSNNNFAHGSALGNTAGLAMRLCKNYTSLTHGQAGTYVGNDGRVYPTICIGNQEWLAVNIAETMFRNGDLIPKITDNLEWNSLTTGALCAYNNDESNVFETTPIEKEINDKDVVEFIAGENIRLELVDKKLIITYVSPTPSQIKSIVQGDYRYDSQMMAADSVGDWRSYSDYYGYYFQYCTVAGTTKGSGTWVLKNTIAI